MTPTPTLAPTATSTTPAINIPTPTLIPEAVGTPVIDLDTNMLWTGMAQQGVGQWQNMNRDGVIDGIMIIFVVIIVLGGLRMIMKEIQSD